MFDPKVEHCDIFFFFFKFRNILSFTFYLQPQSREQLISFKVLPLPFIFFLPLLFVFLQGECNSLLKQFLLFLANGFRRRQSKANFPFLSAALDGE